MEWNCFRKDPESNAQPTLWQSEHMALVATIRNTPVAPRQLVQPDHMVPDDQGLMSKTNFKPYGECDRDYCPCFNKPKDRKCDCEPWIDNEHVCCHSTYAARDLWETYVAAEKLYGQLGGNLYLASMIQPNPHGKKPNSPCTRSHLSMPLAMSVSFTFVQSSSSIYSMCPRENWGNLQP